MGRIGKNVMRVILEKLDDRFDIVAGNDLVPAAAIAASLPKDSVYGRYPAAVELLDETTMLVGRHRVALYGEKDAALVPWGEHNVDIVFECTGFYLSTEKAAGHLTGGAKRVIVSAPCSDDTATVVVGVNHDSIGAEQKIISNASCTTNCLAPLTKAIDMTYPVQAGLMSTTHAATATQKIADAFGGGKNRATLNNIIPASTGAAIAVGKVLPHLNGKLNGTALRVPTDTGSVVEAVYLVDGTPSKAEVVAALASNAAQINASSLLGQVMVVGDYYECSRDCVGEPYSSMVSDNVLVVSTGSQSLIKATSFYDNEMGFSHRMAELALILAAD
jgi:glyceraldehyde 3-phosphate dehydrogenase